MNVPIDRGNLGRGVIRNWDKIHLNVNLLMHGNWIAYFQDMEPPKSWSILRKSSNVLKPIRCVRFTKAVVRHADIRDQNPSRGIICPGDPHQRNPQCSKIWGSVSRSDGMARAMCPWSSVEAGQKYPKMKGETWNNILFTFGELVSICAIMQHHTFCRDTEETEMAPSPANCWSLGLVRTRSKAGRPAKIWDDDLNELVKDEETQTTRSNVSKIWTHGFLLRQRSTNGKRKKENTRSMLSRAEEPNTAQHNDENHLHIPSPRRYLTTAISLTTVRQRPWALRTLKARTSTEYVLY